MAAGIERCTSGSCPLVFNTLYGWTLKPFPYVANFLYFLDFYELDFGKVLHLLLSLLQEGEGKS